MQTKILIIVIMMLVLLLSQSILAVELDRDQIRITIRINEWIEVQIDDNLLDFDLVAGVSSNIMFKVLSNSLFTVSFESIDGFGEELNDLFEYAIIYTVDGKEKEVTFKPGSYIPTGVIVIEPGKTEWQLIVRLREEIAQQWQIILEEGIENIDIIEIGTDWTALTPGEYTDFINMTFHKHDIDRYIIESYE